MTKLGCLSITILLSSCASRQYPVTPGCKKAIKTQKEVLRSQYRVR